MGYQEFLQQKLIVAQPSGFDVDRATLPGNLYPYQADLVVWGCKRGKAALFCMTGTGKTAMQVSWADQVQSHTAGNVLILAPLAVAKQTVTEAAKFGIHVNYVRHASEVKRGISIANYEMLHHFEGCEWAGIVLDESAILRNFAGKTRNYIMAYSHNIPFKLAATAVPSPNDFMEIGNHAEFLGVMRHTEMLATFFTHDGGDTAKWRIKGHAKEAFWKWLGSFGVFLNRPSDLGYSDSGFELPPLYTHQHIVESGATEGALFAFEAHGLQERQAARRESIARRAEKCAQIVAESPRPFMVWCDLNAEADALRKLIPGAVEVRGTDKDEFKEKTILDFAAGKIPVLISKPSIFGTGMNLQICSNFAYMGMSDSFDAIFQSTKRFHRHKQENPCHRHLVISQAEGAVLKNVERKESEFMTLIDNMVKHTKNITMANIKALHREQDEYAPAKTIQLPSWL